jgi:Predicted membrane protein
MSNYKNKSQWYDRKRTFLGLPLSFTKYYVLDEKMIVSSGFLNLHEEEIRLYRVMDITLRQSFGQRILGLGTIHLCTADKSTPELDIKNIKKPREVKELISELVEEARTAKRIIGREYMGTDFDDYDNPDTDDDFSHQ